MKVELKPFQQKLVDALKTAPGMLAYWGTGSGKTIGSIGVGESQGGAEVIVPAPLRENFKKELKKFHAKQHYDIQSYEGFVKNPPSLKNRTVIVDEAHRLRNVTSERSQAFADQVKDAKKVVLLTGTPIQNKPHEIAPLMNAVSRRNLFPTKPEEFNRRYIKTVMTNPPFTDRLLYNAKPAKTYEAQNLGDFKRRVKGLVSYYKPEASIEDYPSSSEHIVKVPMSPKQTLMYKLLENRLPPTLRWKMHKSLPTTKSEGELLNSFMTATRQIANTSHEFDKNYSEKFDAPKLHSIVENIKRSKGPALVYSNYLDSGLNPLSKLLTAHDIPHEIYTGALNDKEKKSLVEKYNTGQTKALLVSSAGAEGLDLKKTRQVHIMEPHWNSAKIDQVVGRAIRYKSHSELPVEERHVDVFKYLSTQAAPHPKFIQRILGNHPHKTIDEFLDDMGKQKSALNNKFLNALRESSIENTN
jgi:SNF2 family DNA or RNA helicase